MMFDFVDGATGTETGARLNMAALQRVRLQPRALVNVEARDLATTILGRETGLPFGIAPMGMCNLTCPHADRIMALEALKHGLPVCVSSASSSTLEQMAEWSEGRAWFQLYVGQSQAAAFEMVDRAAAAGYEHLILTVDTPQVAKRFRDLKNGFQVPFKIGLRQIIDFATHPRWSIATLRAGVPKPMIFETSSTGRAFVRGESRAGTDWIFLETLRARWKAKLIVKGVTSPLDAIRIKDTGVDAIYVSTHGGRQLDAGPPAIRVLPAIREAIGDMPLIFDSGIRSGEDVVKALASGADFVMLGRATMYALGADGARGLTSLFDDFGEEISVVMAQLGLTRVKQIDGTVLADPWEER